MTIREATKNDIEVLSELATKTYLDAFGLYFPHFFVQQPCIRYLKLKSAKAQIAQATF